MAHLDERRVADLLEIFGPEDLSLVVEAFLEEAGQAVAGLARLVSEQADQVRDQQLHYLVGSAANMGAAGFAALCENYKAIGRFSSNDHARICAGLRDTCSAFDEIMRHKASNAA